MNSSEIQKRDGDTINNNCNNVCIGKHITNTEFKNQCKPHCEADFQASCIVKSSSDLLLYFIAVLIGGLLLTAIIFWARKRCKRRKEKRKPEVGTLIVSDIERNTGPQKFPVETHSHGTRIPTYI